MPLTTPIARSRRRHRTGSLLALAGVAVLALAGCGRLDADLRVNIDDTTDGTIVLAVPDRVATALGETPDALWQRVLDQHDLAARLGDSATSAPYHAGGYTGTKITLHATPLADLATAVADGPGDETLTIARQAADRGDQFVVDVHLDLSAATLARLGDEDAGTASSAAGGDAATASPAGDDVELALTFPGKVASADGTGASSSENTVTWSSSDGVLDGHAVAWSSNQGTRVPWYVFALPALVLATIVTLVLTTVARNRRRDAAGGPPSRH
ncbi:LppM family (lipo)protein [Luteimicrobium subarcticum]|uniref:LppM domain-containing protein n=1 Tax=Luteimicrobium subarcticum TaxID=620910 RepID=A0A2M8WS56_9MICO|nr:hypothetical protein [Luteimicrobium subarcticum]PJI93748.1 hypothetical protein CLV34_1223 [Luteimicrobium subarcticum]